MMPEFPSKNKLPFDLVILLLEKSPRNPKSPVQKNLCTSMFIAAQFTTAKCWKQTRCPLHQLLIDYRHMNFSWALYSVPIISQQTRQPG